MNNELGASFDLSTFFFHSYFDSYEGCIKNFLVSRISQDVEIKKASQSYHFEEFEAVLVEESHKRSST